MRRIALAFILGFLFPAFAGAHTLVGGPCRYETRIGVARIAGNHDGEMKANFYVGPNHFSVEHFPYSPGMRFTIREPITGSVSTPYPAQLRKEAEGTCTPYSLSLLATEARSTSIFLPFDTNGNPTAETEQKFRQIAYTTKTLHTHWPHLRITLNGHAATGSSGEYRHNLAERYAQIAVRKLTALGVTDELLLQRAEEDGAALFGDEEASGVYIRFELRSENPSQSIH